VALLEGAWLQAVAGAANATQPVVNHLFAAYLALLGQHEANSPAFAYRGRLYRRGVHLPQVTAWRFAQTPGLGAAAMRFASLQLALGFHAAEWLPETLGFTLAYLHSASPWRLSALPPPRRLVVLSAMTEHVNHALQAGLEEGFDLQRLRRGIALYNQAEADYLAQLHCADSRKADLTGQIGQIFRGKLRFAAGYHRQVELGGRGLEEWFADTPFDAAGFLAAFAASPYSQGESGRRPFDQLTGFGGAMFGVFSPDERALIRVWLDGVQQPRPTQADTPADSLSQPNISGTPPQLLTRPLNIVRPEPVEGRVSTGSTRTEVVNYLAGLITDQPTAPPKPLWPTWNSSKAITNRRLFHELLKPAPDAPILAAARRQLDRTLARASGKTRSSHGPFFVYTPTAFARHVAQIHQTEIAKHQPFKPPPKLRRDDYIFGIRQFAPAILVDGCWLQTTGDAALQDSRLHRLLQRIYAEELGEGRRDWNHPKIYRDLLNELAIDLPPTETEAFAQHPSFLDSAFDLPCHLLSIARWPRSYLPELLGLNLAIELSGLGAGYLRLAAELRHWNINPLIVTLHQSIDNLATGHAAMACEAIQLYLDEMQATGGEAAVQAHWQRIWSGYQSLPTATRRFKWAMIWAFCRRFLNRQFNRQPPIMP
jgi:hypothetical protein